MKVFGRDIGFGTLRRACMHKLIRSKININCWVRSLITGLTTQQYKSQMASWWAELGITPQSLVSKGGPSWSLGRTVHPIGCCIWTKMPTRYRLQNMQLQTRLQTNQRLTVGAHGVKETKPHSCKGCYWRTTHKFGIQIPKTVKEALAIDKETGTDFWRKALRLTRTVVRCSLWHGCHTLLHIWRRLASGPDSNATQLEIHVTASQSGCLDSERRDALRHGIDYIDNILVFAKEPKVSVDKLGKLYKLKPESVHEPDVYPWVASVGAFCSYDHNLLRI